MTTKSESQLIQVEEIALAMAQATIQATMKRVGLSPAQLAERMACPQSFVTRILKGDHDLTIRQFARALAACGVEPRFDTVEPY